MKSGYGGLDGVRFADRLHVAAAGHGKVKITIPFTPPRLRGLKSLIDAASVSISCRAPCGRVDWSRDAIPDYGVLVGRASRRRVD